MTQTFLSERLAEARTRKGYTQQQIADFLDCNRATITNYENGKRTPDVDTIVKLAKHYEVSADYLLGITNAKIQDDTVQFISKHTNLPDMAITFLLDDVKSKAVVEFLSCGLATFNFSFKTLANLFARYKTTLSDYNQFKQNIVAEFREITPSQHQDIIDTNQQFADDRDLLEFKIQRALKEFLSDYTHKEERISNQLDEDYMCIMQNLYDYELSKKIATDTVNEGD